MRDFRPRFRPAALLAAVGFLPVALVSGCSQGPLATGQVVTLAEARAAVIHHWDVNRQALRASSGSRASALITQVESGDALRMDRYTIVRDADNRGAKSSPEPAIPDATGVRVFVPRQAAYPAVFMSIRTQAAPPGLTPARNNDVLEVFRKANAHDSWHNSAYAELAPGMTASLHVELDRDGYAAFADGPPAPSEISDIYTRYLNAKIGGHPDQAPSRVLAGPLTDKLAASIAAGLGAIPTIQSTVSFATAAQQDGIKLKSGDGGRLVLFADSYDLVTTSKDGGCVTAGPNSPVPAGPHTRVTEHLLQDAVAFVAAGTGGSVSVVAVSDGPVGVETTPCSGGSGTTI